MKRIVVRLAITAAAIYAATRFVNGIHFTGGVVTMFAVALVFTVVNALLKPLITLLTCPLIILTLGFFTLVINGIMLLVTASLSESLGLHFAVDNLVAAFWGGLVIGVCSMILTLFVDTRKEPAS
jgi:putative membrane protein